MQNNDAKCLLGCRVVRNFCAVQNMLVELCSCTIDVETGDACARILPLSAADFVIADRQCGGALLFIPRLADAKRDTVKRTARRMRPRACMATYKQLSR